MPMSNVGALLFLIWAQDLALFVLKQKIALSQTDKPSLAK